MLDIPLDMRMSASATSRPESRWTAFGHLLLQYGKKLPLSNVGF